MKIKGKILLIFSAAVICLTGMCEKPQKINAESDLEPMEQQIIVKNIDGHRQMLSNIL